MTTKPRTRRELPIGQAIEKLAELQLTYDAGLEIAMAVARDKYTEEHADRIERILSRVHPDARDLVRAKAMPPEPVEIDEPEVTEPSETAAAIANGTLAELPAGAKPLDPERAQRLERMAGRGR